MYSPEVTRLFQEQRHCGTVEGGVRSVAGTPGQGPYIQLEGRFEEDVLRAARWKTYGCPAAIAASEAACRWSEGRRRAELLEVTAQDVTTWVGSVPEGKEHCPELAVHALRNALVPVVTLAGLQLPALFSGVVFVETIFAWPGMGRVMVQAVLARDYPVVMAATAVFAALVVVGNALADVAAGWVDPRMRN